MFIDTAKIHKKWEMTFLSFNFFSLIWMQHIFSNKTIKERFPVTVAN